MTIWKSILTIWNLMISQMTKNKKDTIRLKAECLAAKIRKQWMGGRFQNEEKEVGLCYTFQIQLHEILTVASLAHHGLLGSVKEMYLQYLDLASVPAEHLASLASCVTNKVYIFKVNNCDIISILASVKCDELVISSQTLSSQETQAVVQAMANVEEVYLGDRFGYHRIEVRLDISTLVTYGGRGKCQKVVFYYDTADKYREEVLRWAHRISWGVRIERGYPFDGIIIESTPEAPEAPWC